MATLPTTSPSPRPTAPVTELSVPEALDVAVQLQRAGLLEQAETVYLRILAVAPEHADAMHFYGLLLHGRGSRDEGLNLVRRSLTAGPEQADRYNNLGNLLVAHGQRDEAEAAYRRALALRSDHADACNNLGRLLKAVGRYAEADTAYVRAIECDPQLVAAHFNRGNLFAVQGRTEEAVACYCRAATLDPAHGPLLHMLGIGYYTLRQMDQAAQVFRAWLAHDPDNPVAQHMVCACAGGEMPARASDGYIEATFDAFADSFEAKLGHLGYRAPQLVADALARACPRPAKALACLDAGCGTGLCGPLLAPYAASLCGVDLSGGMLEKARARGVYDRLFRAELTAHLRGYGQAFDLIVSADTLVYFGDLEAVFAAAATALRPRGLLIFTLEEAADEPAVGYRLNPHGRYSHTRAYVAAALAGAGLSLTAMAAATLRNEGGVPVCGLLVTATQEGTSWPA